MATPFEANTALSATPNLDSESAPTKATPGKILWYRSTWFAALVLGLCNFAAPGIWGAMSSLGKWLSARRQRSASCFRCGVGSPTHQERPSVDTFFYLQVPEDWLSRGR